MQHYCMDDITQRTNCTLHIPTINRSTRVVYAVVSPVVPREVIHGMQIRASYAKVQVEQVEKKIMGLVLDIPRGDAETPRPPSPHQYHRTPSMTPPSRLPLRAPSFSPVWIQARVQLDLWIIQVLHLHLHNHSGIRLLRLPCPRRKSGAV